MPSSRFWKCVALAHIAAAFYIGHGLHQLGSDRDQSLLPAVSAAEPSENRFPIRWMSVNQSDHVPNTSRTRVEGGWLVMARDEFKKQFGIAFVPDADHSWQIAR